MAPWPSFGTTARHLDVVCRTRWLSRDEQPNFQSFTNADLRGSSAATALMATLECHLIGERRDVGKPKPFAGVKGCPYGLAVNRGVVANRETDGSRKPVVAERLTEKPRQIDAHQAHRRIPVFAERRFQKSVRHLFVKGDGNPGRGVIPEEQQSVSPQAA
jgi:hypothetical protein